MQAARAWRALEAGTIRRLAAAPRVSFSFAYPLVAKITLLATRQPTRHLTSDSKQRRNHVGAKQSTNRYEDQDVIDTSSLSQTLAAHRRANDESILIRKIGGPPPGPETTTEDRARTKTARRTSHLVLHRKSEQPSPLPRDEYEGRSRGLSLEWEVIGEVARHLRTPWIEELDRTRTSREGSSDRLSQEIRAADAFFTPTPMEATAATQIRLDIASALQSYPKMQPWKLDLIGSRANGLATPLSDIDLNLMDPRVERDPITDGTNKKILSSLWANLKYHSQEFDEISMSYFALHARVPIVVGVHTPTGLEFQIQSASTGYGSLEVVKGLAAELPTLRALFKIVKQMLRIRGLTEGVRGGLTSYPLLIMIAVSLKHHASSANPYDIGSHLLNFLDFYGNIDFYTHGITHVPSKYFLDDTGSLDCYGDDAAAEDSIALVTRDPVGARPLLFQARKKLSLIHNGKDDYMMALHDPANPYNDLGRSARLIKHMQATFLDIRSKLKEDMSAWDRQIRAEGQAAEQPQSLLRSLIEGDYSMYIMERKRLSAWHQSRMHKGTDKT